MEGVGLTNNGRVWQHRRHSGALMEGFGLLSLQWASLAAAPLTGDAAPNGHDGLKKG